MKLHKFFRTAAIAALAIATTMTAACGGTGSSGSSGETLTVYSADGLATWYKSQFDKFTKDTGIAVNLVEAGSGEVVSRVEKEQSNPQADVLVTLPPFIQKADKSGLLVASGVDTKGIPADQVGPGGNYVPIVNNALNFIANPSANPQPKTWDDLLAPQYKGKLQYSTPGQAGDGTAVLILLQHLRGKQGALDYLTKLQANNVGPSSSTGKLQPKVSNGELLVANGDVQMNLGSIKDDGSKFNIFIPAGPDGKRTTISLPYVAAVAKGAPHEASAKKLLGSCCPTTYRRRSSRTRWVSRCVTRSAPPQGVRPHRTLPPGSSTASTCGYPTGTPSSPSLTPTWPRIRRRPGTEVTARRRARVRIAAKHPKACASEDRSEARARTGASGSRGMEPSRGRPTASDDTARRADRNPNAGNHIRPRRRVIWTGPQGDEGVDRLQPAGGGR